MTHVPLGRGLILILKLYDLKIPLRSGFSLVLAPWHSIWSFGVFHHPGMILYAITPDY